ncbi:hypothetical protein EVAR_14931_1 [Eumeta japonica]|uniref:Uncharacterized protein n=1 Tax=Eumeta variegata TaxID=151549 RepID=A0A4C1XMZ0_EUMVA|nr:hypothetical protein EVAR_14931_1 [Eumeta japonica]
MTDRLKFSIYSSGTMHTSLLHRQKLSSIRGTASGGGVKRNMSCLNSRGRVVIVARDTSWGRHSSNARVFKNCSRLIWLSELTRSKMIWAFTAPTSTNVTNNLNGHR